VGSVLGQRWGRLHGAAGGPALQSPIGRRALTSSSSPGARRCACSVSGEISTQPSEAGTRLLLASARARAVTGAPSEGSHDWLASECTIVRAIGGAGRCWARWL
jgi:hypothetical protein